jgi:DNA-binding LytR/AlgR family response regulator
MNNKLPKALSDKQEQTRQQTINKVLHALSDLQAQGCRVSIKNLMEYTGLSRSVFSKPHVRALLADYGYAPAQAEAEPADGEEKPDKAQRLLAEIRKKNAKIEKLREENSEMKAECELLRGKLFLLMQKLSDE